jgi:hypothetical protein
MQTGSEPDPASYSVSTRCSFLRGKADECDADPQPPSSELNFRMQGAIPPIPMYLYGMVLSKLQE